MVVLSIVCARVVSWSIYEVSSFIIFCKSAYMCFSELSSVFRVSVTDFRLFNMWAFAAETFARDVDSILSFSFVCISVRYIFCMSSEVARLKTLPQKSPQERLVLYTKVGGWEILVELRVVGGVVACMLYCSCWRFILENCARVMWGLISGMLNMKDMSWMSDDFSFWSIIRSSARIASSG